VLILNLGGTRAGDDPIGALGGPGSRAVPDAATVHAAQERGHQVLGYIRTGATGSNDGPRRDRAYTDREIRDLRVWYDVDGIFYDEVYADSRYLSNYEISSPRSVDHPRRLAHGQRRRAPRSDTWTASTL
jgi:hypothetical protein